ncbi:hypothetical protein [Neisseria dumasiana]|nr:hypothetical protein [Neisseria dumasiana]
MLFTRPYLSLNLRFSATGRLNRMPACSPECFQTAFSPSVGAAAPLSR